MEIRGPNDAHRSDLNRATDSKRSSRPPAGSAKRAGSSPSLDTDRVESSSSELVEASVGEVQTGLEQRISEVLARRDELLALAHDPEAIRKAAANFLKLA